MIRSSLILFAAALAAQSPPPVVAPVAPVPATPVPIAAVQPVTKTRAVDLAICLDISGSMDGLINQARQNLWAVVNELATLKPTPTLRVALLTFGCQAHEAEKGWVKVETDFTTDLDLVSQKLFALTTNGGEEYVARVVQTALRDLQWSTDKQSLQLLFVAGNEAATQDPQVPTADAAKAAIARGIVVNTIYCGNPGDELAPAWREVAKLADGQFAAIQQNDTVVIETPFDKQLSELSIAMNTTYVPYGAQRTAWADNQRAQDGNAARLNLAAAAQRCQTKAGELYDNPQWDLVDATKDPKFDLAALKKDDLPEALRALSLDALKAHVASNAQRRGELKGKVDDLGKQRDAFVQQELGKLGKDGKQRFEQAVLESVRQQAKARGFEPKPAPQPVKAKDVESPFTETIKAAAKDYQAFPRVTGEAKRAPTDCRLPPTLARRSAAEKEHGQKLYLLYARMAENGEYLKAGQPAQVGQTLVKESWQCVDGPQAGKTEASERYSFGAPVLQEGDKVCHAGAFHGLFVMHKLAADTKDTDQGWIYGTIDRDGVVTAAGKVASCIQCHQDAVEDRRFGLR